MSRTAGRYHRGSVLGPIEAFPLKGHERGRWEFAMLGRFKPKSVTVRVGHALGRCLSYEGFCFPSYEHLAALAACHRNSVLNAIKKLAAAGLLQWKRRVCLTADAAGLRQTSNAYRLVLPEATSPEEPEEAVRVESNPAPDIVVEAEISPESPRQEPSAPLVSPFVLIKRRLLTVIDSSTISPVQPPLELDLPTLAEHRRAMEERLATRQDAAVPRWKRNMLRLMGQPAATRSSSGVVKSTPPPSPLSRSR